MKRFSANLRRHFPSQVPPPPLRALGLGQVHNAEPAELAELAEFFFREIRLRVLSLRYRAKNQNAELAELDLNFIK